MGAKEELAALREGLEALHVRRGDGAAREAAGKPAWPNNVARDLRALIAPSPAEGTGEAALCPTCQHQRWKHDANGCAHREPGESICGCDAPTPVATPSTEG